MAESGFDRLVLLGHGSGEVLDESPSYVRSASIAELSKRPAEVDVRNDLDLSELARVAGLTQLKDALYCRPGVSTWVFATPADHAAAFSRITSVHKRPTKFHQARSESHSDLAVIRAIAGASVKCRARYVFDDVADVLKCVPKNIFVGRHNEAVFDSQMRAPRTG